MTIPLCRHCGRDYAVHSQHLGGLISPQCPTRTYWEEKPAQLTSPTDAELREWRSLRSLPQPGPSTIYTVYRIAFPALLDSYDDLSSKLETMTRERDELTSRDKAFSETGHAMLEDLEQDKFPQMGDWGTVQIGKSTVRAIGELRAERDELRARLAATTIKLPACTCGASTVCAGLYGPPPHKPDCAAFPRVAGGAGSTRLDTDYG